MLILIQIGAMGVPAQGQVVAGIHQVPQDRRIQAILVLRPSQPVDIVVPDGDLEAAGEIRPDHGPQALVGGKERLFVDATLEAEVVDLVATIQPDEADAQIGEGPDVVLVASRPVIFLAIGPMVEGGKGFQTRRIPFLVGPEVEATLLVHQSRINAGGPVRPQVEEPCADAPVDVVVPRNQDHPAEVGDCEFLLEPVDQVVGIGVLDLLGRLGQVARDDQKVRPGQPFLLLLAPEIGTQCGQDVFVGDRFVVGAMNVREVQNGDPIRGLCLHLFLRNSVVNRSLRFITELAWTRSQEQYTMSGPNRQAPARTTSARAGPQSSTPNDNVREE